MNYLDIKAAVKELGDGRTFSSDENKRWIERVRKRVAMDFATSGFHGLFFLYKEATVEGGSTIADPNRYAVPDDFIDDLNVFYDGTLLVKASAGLLDIAEAEESGATSPTWVTLVGQEFQIVPVPSEAGKEIKLLYNALPETITVDTQEDYFMKHFPDLHIFGMGELMALRLGNVSLADRYRDDFDRERVQLRLHNVRHYTKNIRIRFQNWDEYTNIRHIVFPQFVNL
jgi:hypothetical protein